MGKMDLHDIKMFLIINEPAFDVGDVQYSVCVPEKDIYCTWDSTGEVHDFYSLEALLDQWMIQGRPFREVIKEIM